jgi:hypothetical protein
LSEAIACLKDRAFFEAKVSGKNVAVPAGLCFGCENAPLY